MGGVMVIDCGGMSAAEMKNPRHAGIFFAFSKHRKCSENLHMAERASTSAISKGVQ
jgi:hypothetical protein